MLKQLLAPQLVILYILAASTIYVHFRGKQRLRFARQLGDHSTYLAPYNVLMYAGSAVPNKPVISVDQFPELKPLSENWETLRGLAALSPRPRYAELEQVPHPRRRRRMRLARRRGLHVRRDLHPQRGECDRRQPHHPVLR